MSNTIITTAAARHEVADYVTNQLGNVSKLPKVKALAKIQKLADDMGVAFTATDVYTVRDNVETLADAARAAYDAHWEAIDRARYAEIVRDAAQASMLAAAGISPEEAAEYERAAIDDICTAPAADDASTLTDTEIDVTDVDETLQLLLIDLQLAKADRRTNDAKKIRAALRKAGYRISDHKS